MMADCVVFDIRQLQKSVLHYRPIDRIFIDLIGCLVADSLQKESVKIFADHSREIPSAVAHLSERIVYSVPFRREPVLVVELSGSDVALRDLVSPQIRAMVQVVTVADGGVADQADVDGKQILALRLRATSSGREIDEELTLAVPTIVDESLFGEPDPLDMVQLDVFFGDSVPVLAVDGALAVNKDIMRAVLGLTRRNPARILVCGDRAAVDAPEVSVLRAGPALLAQIARRSLAVLVPQAGGAEALSMSEVLQLGGRCVAVGDMLDVHDMGELEALPVGLSQSLEKPDYEALWTRILASLPQITPAAVPERPRIALVTPMFPQKGGPPHTSLDFALALAEIAEVEIWTDSDMLPAHRARLSGVYRLDGRFDPERYDGIAYVLGNHPMYLKIFDLMREHGGTLILHDAHMIDFLYHCYGSKRLGILLSEEYGAPIDATDLSPIIGKLANYGRPFLREIVRHASSTIVHSPAAAELLKSLYGVEANYFPLAMHNSFEKTELTPEARLRAKLALGIAPSRPCIASFGEVHMMKGAKQCLFVMKELVDWGVDFQFLFVGPVDRALGNELKDRIKQYGLQGHVAMKGAVSEADYIEHLKAVDIALQIRQIPFGQVSGVLLDAVSAGMHAVASENLARSIEAPAMVRRVNDKASPTMYAEQLAEMIQAKSYEDRPGPGWDDFVTKHAFSRYARNFLSLLFPGRR